MATSAIPSAAASLITPPLDDLSFSRNRELGLASRFPQSPFFSGSDLLILSPPLRSPRRELFKRYRYASVKNSFEHIPKRFREENLKDGLMENYKNVPKSLYGLTASQMDMFMTEDNPASRQSQKVTEESISSARNYLGNGGMYSLSGMEDSPSRFSMSVSMYRGGARGYGRPRSAPPDLPSLLLDARICYLGMPIVPAVTELLVAQLMWLDYDNPSKPIYLYINSSGTQNEKRETVGSETEAYAIADMMAFKSVGDIYQSNPKIMQLTGKTVSSVIGLLRMAYYKGEICLPHAECKCCPTLGVPVSFELTKPLRMASCKGKNFSYKHGL